MPDRKPTLKVPDHMIESLARCILPSIRKYFESEDGQREFEEWRIKKGRGDTKNSHDKYGNT